MAALGLLFFGPTSQAGEFPQVRIETTAGTFTVELDDERAPLTVENFLKYVNDGFYQGTIFHRVVGNFVIQGGGYDPDLKAKNTRAPIANESGNGLQNRRLTIAMARTGNPPNGDRQFSPWRWSGGDSANRCLTHLQSAHGCFSPSSPG
ncbi:MAG: peptidylprolyl isomerase, partial [Gammaproteobacteria bacterium]|nr:peptidylprolyl isomerase [Gammaproteobacteria bacterium]